MADRPDTEAYPDDDARARSDRGSPHSTSLWVKLAAIAIAIVLLLLIVALHATGAIGPGLHRGLH